MDEVQYVDSPSFNGKAFDQKGEIKIRNYLFIYNEESYKEVVQRKTYFPGFCFFPH